VVKSPYLNYAIPDDRAAPTAADVRALVRAYRKHRRKPRLEYITSIAPAIEPALLEAGFEVEGRLPLMRFRGAPGRRPPAGIELVEPTSDHEFSGVAAVQWEAYAETGAVPDAMLRVQRRILELGGQVLLARDVQTGEPVGAGACTSPYEGATELTSLAVVESYRRRGIAEAMTRWLARSMQARGNDLVFLMAAGDAEARIYERAGFETISDILHISRR
jgi:ribosomal protein S18 acetylase RimI-like enzyme